MNKRSHSHKKADSSASNPVKSQFQSRPFIAQAKPQSEKPLTQTETENQEFQQQKFEAMQLNLQAKNGTITPEGQERLTVLQAKMSGTLQRKLEQASSNGSNFANIPISRQDAPSKLAVQTKLTIGEPGDKFEKEADQVAEQVDKLIHAPVSQQVDQNLQPEEKSVEEKELQMKPMLQLRAAEGGMTATVGMETAINQARGGGQSLADNVRKPMEKFLGADFSRVKVHIDTTADMLNRSLQARAFTTGQDVFFRKGEYNPASREGQKLIFHEVAHVAQQNGDKAQGHKHETGKVSKKTRKIQRMNVVQPQNGVTTFQNEIPGHDYLVANITPTMTDDQTVSQLLLNFYQRGDFNYTGTYSPRWGHRGDCHTLVDEFIATAAYFNIQMTHLEVNGPLFIQGGGRIIHNQQRTGNVDNGNHWRFDNHHIAQWNGTNIDVLFGRMPARPAVQIQEDRRTGVFTIGGTTYYIANNATSNETNTFTSNYADRMDFSSLPTPRREIKTRFCCCSIM